MSTLQIYTSTEIARLLSSDVRRVRHILHSRPHIQPVHKAGKYSLYDPSVVLLVRRELEAMQTKQQPQSDSEAALVGGRGDERTDQ